MNNFTQVVAQGILLGFALGFWLTWRALLWQSIAKRKHIEHPSNVIPVCRHKHIEPVIAAGETEPIAAMCVDCLVQLPLEDWKSRNECSDCGWLDLWAGGRRVAHHVNKPCARHR